MFDPTQDMGDMSFYADGPVICTLPLREGVIYLAYIYTPKHLRGRGLMRDMFNRFIADVDKRKLNVFMLLLPDEDTDEERLRDMYTRYGFDFGDTPGQHKTAVRDYEAAKN